MHSQAYSFKSLDPISEYFAMSLNFSIRSDIMTLFWLSPSFFPSTVWAVELITSFNSNIDSLYNSVAFVAG